MGDGVEKKVKRAAIAVSTGGLSEHKAITKPLAKPLRTGASATAREAKKTLSAQQQKESALLAEKESEIATQRHSATKGGRKSLIKSAGGGLAQNLGGTA